MSRFLKKLFLPSILLLALTLSIFYLSSFFPEFTEKYYSRGFYRALLPSYSRFTALVPFSLAEILIGLVFTGSLIFIRKLILIKKGSEFPALIKSAFSFLIVLYVIFIFSWGINYNRLNFFEIAGFEEQPINTEELESLCKNLIIRVNQLREEVSEDQNGVMKLSGNLNHLFQRAGLGYTRASDIYPVLGSFYGTPKKVIFSELMSYLGLGGFYFPFTAEANINVNLPSPMLPFITAHEIAHQHGFAREDEANYLAYLTSDLHPDLDFRYSGNLMALLYAMRALNSYEPETVMSLQAQYSVKVQADLAAFNQYWEKYDTPLDNLSTKINNLYLKANLQEDGVAGYGRMIDLLLAQYRQQKTHSEPKI